jgi:subtilisin family serine protease
MTRIVLAAWVLVLAMAGAAAAASVVPPDIAQRAATAGAVRVIVQMAAPVVPQGAPDEHAALTAQVQAVGAMQNHVLGRLAGVAHRSLRQYATLPALALEGGADLLQELDRLGGLVISVEEDRLHRPTLSQSGPLVQAPSAWAAGLDGTGKVIAVLDTGVDKTHPFLAGKVVEEACFSGNASCPNGQTSQSGFNAGIPCTYASGCFHGTFVAGVAAGAGSGIARGAQLMAIQVFSRFTGASCAGDEDPCTRAFTSDILAGLDRVNLLKASRSFAAANLSLGGGFFSNQASCDAANVSMKATIDVLRASGIATVIASGNEAFTNGLASPACISTAISVGSTGDGSGGATTDVVSSFSNSASFLSLLAPGANITSSTPGGGFGTAQGTSFSAPHVAGAWAILRQFKPTASVSEILSVLQATGLSVNDVRNGIVKRRIRIFSALSQMMATGGRISIDSPAAGATLPQSFVVAGWALDLAATSGTGVDTVHVYAVTSGGSSIFLGVATYGNARPDVAAAFGGQFINSGFGLSVGGLAPGSYTLRAFARSTVTGGFTIIANKAITVANGARMSVDTPAPGSAPPKQPFLVAGWALDLGASSGTGVGAVHVYAAPAGGGAPIFLGVASYGAARPDIGAIFGAQFTNSGYGIFVGGLSPGSYVLQVFALSTVTGTFNNVKAVPITILATGRIAVDTPSPGATTGQPFVIAGWALDLAAASGSGVTAVHVYALPLAGGPMRFVGVAAYGTPRPDLAAIFGAQFTNSGYVLSASGLPSGSYQLQVFALSSVTGSFSIVQVVNVTVLP